MELSGASGSGLRDATALRFEASIACPLSLVIDEAHVIVPLLESPSPGLRVELRELGIPYGLGMSHRVVTSFARESDREELDRPHDAIVFEWSADSFLLPNFCGTLRFRVETVDRTRLESVGTYVPPFGAAGVMFDRIAGRRLALATLEHIVHAFARRLESLWAAARPAAPPLVGRIDPVA